MTARRITVYRRHDGTFGYKVQAANWRTVETAEQGFARKATVLKRVEKKYPGVEIVDKT